MTDPRTCRRPAPATGAGPKENAPARKHLHAQRSATSQQWAAAVSREPLTAGARLVAGQLVDRAGRDGRVRVTAAELAACTCLSVTQVANAMAYLASRELLAHEGRTLVLARSGAAP